jgi:hypothetical protein
MLPLSASGRLSDRTRILIGAGIGYAILLSLMAVRATSDSEATLYYCSVLIGMSAVLLPLLVINDFSFSPSEKKARRLKAAGNTLSRSFWLEWVGVMPSTLAPSLMPSLLREEWNSDHFLIGALIGAGFALLLAGWNREEARDYLAKHQPET